MITEIELALIAALLPTTHQSIRVLRTRLIDYFDALSEGAVTSEIPSEREVELVTRELLALPPSSVRDRGLAAAIGLQQNLFSIRRQASAAERAA